MPRTRPHTVLLAPLGLLLASPAIAQSPAPLITPPAHGDPFADTFGGLRFDSRLPSPLDFLGYEIGERFTAQSDAVAYLTALADASDRVLFEQYGATHERRPLHTLTISSPANLARLDEILARNLALADPRNTSDADARNTFENNPAVVWLSFNVHGNEASSTETAIQLAYTLGAASNQEVRDILDNLVIVIDPMVNPDGHERYVSWYTSTVGAAPDANPDGAEHDEPWPGGRTNHYLFDLNRDWLWGVHPESRARLGAYRRYLPQLHVDYHEQDPASPYFFGAGEKPYNRNIPEETKDWISRYGESNARAFDARALPYSTRERFDYLYPGYGKVLPCYQGAIGLLCEKGGHGRAGLAIELSDRETVTLRRRATDHFVTAIDYLGFTAQNRREQLERFRRFFQAGLASSRTDAPSAYIIGAGNDPALLRKVWDLCAMQGIEVYRPLDIAGSTVGEIAISDYWSGAEVPRPRSHLWEGAWIIPAAQPRSALVHAHFERSTAVEEKETYDITGWSLPVVFGLDAWFTHEPIDRLTLARVEAWSPEPAALTGAGDVALLVDSSQHSFPRAVASVMERELIARRVGEAITTADGAAFPAGSLIVHAAPNDAGAINSFAQDCLGAGLVVLRAAGHV